MSQKSNQDQTSVEWLEVRAIFERCTELPPEERETYLNTTLGARRDLRIQVERLLKKSEVAQGVMESPLLLALPSTGDVPFRPFRVGKYVLLRRLGSGGMAEVFLALSLGPESFERHLALKRILPFYSQEEEFRAFFVAEAKISSRLAHPNIVHVYDFFESNRSYFLSMEYVSGKNLGQVVGMLEVKGIQLPVECALHIVSEICKGLGYAHTRTEDRGGAPMGIVHRDVSPKNVMISYTGEVKIVDFGIAKAKDRAKLTRTGELRGTVNYLSPEVARGEEPDHRADVFSASVILYELIAGKPIFPKGSTLSILRLIQEGESALKRANELAVDPILKSILVKGFQKHPNDRFSSAYELRDAIQMYLTQIDAQNPETALSTLLTREFVGEMEQEKSWKIGIADLGQIAQRSPLASTAKETVVQEKRTNPNKERKYGLGLILLASLALPAAYHIGLRMAEPVRMPAMAPTNRCHLSIVSSPSGATVYAEEKKLGKSPQVLEDHCGRQVSLRIEHDGYEPAVRSVQLDRTAHVFEINLKKAAIGVLELILSRDAKVYFGDQLLAEVLANRKFQLSLPAGTEHSLRFVNQEAGVDVTRRFSTKENEVTNDTIDLEVKPVEE